MTQPPLQDLLKVLSDDNTILVLSEKDKKIIDNAFNNKNGIYSVKKYTTSETVRDHYTREVTYTTLRMTLATLKAKIYQNKIENWQFKVIYTISTSSFKIYLDLAGKLLEIENIIDSSGKIVDLHKNLSAFISTVGTLLENSNANKGNANTGGAPKSQQPIFMSIMNATRQVMKDKKGAYVTLDGKRQYVKDLKEYTVFSMRII